jgi:hypothetical protein
MVSAQHGDLVTKHKDLDVLGCVGPGEQRQPAQHAGEHEVRESKSHSVIMLTRLRVPDIAVSRAGAGQEL